MERGCGRRGGPERRHLSRRGALRVRSGGKHVMQGSAEGVVELRRVPHCGQAHWNGLLRHLAGVSGVKVEI